jgi:hypothetical protein
MLIKNFNKHLGYHISESIFSKHKSDNSDETDDSDDINPTFDVLPEEIISNFKWRKIN